MASSDKLAEIKQRYRDDPNMYWVSEVDWLLGEVERLQAALDIEHESRRVLLERLGIEWTPGEPFVALVEAEIVRLREAVLAYDDAIRDVAKLGKQWVRDDDKLDDLYAEMVTAAGRDIEA
jgi:hypothetical protein